MENWIENKMSFPIRGVIWVRKKHSAYKFGYKTPER